MRKLKISPNGMVCMTDFDNHQKIYFRLEDVAYIAFDANEEAGCSVGLKGTDFWLKVTHEDGKVLLNQKRLIEIDSQHNFQSEHLAEA
jgi:hypothetical protein